MPKIFSSPHFVASCTPEQLALLKTMFVKYKTTGEADPSFGRDVPFEFPSHIANSGLHHIHIKDKTSENWHLKKIQLHKTSDTALIYCEGFYDKSNYLLLGFLENAHDTYRRNRDYLRNLALIADKFRDKY